MHLMLNQKDHDALGRAAKAVADLLEKRPNACACVSLTKDDEFLVDDRRVNGTLILFEVSTQPLGYHVAHTSGLSAEDTELGRSFLTYLSAVPEPA